MSATISFNDFQIGTARRSLEEAIYALECQRSMIYLMAVTHEVHGSYAPQVYTHAYEIFDALGNCALDCLLAVQGQPDKASVAKVQEGAA